MKFWFLLVLVLTGGCILNQPTEVAPPPEMLSASFVPDSAAAVLVPEKTIMEVIKTTDWIKLAKENKIGIVKVLVLLLLVYLVYRRVISWQQFRNVAAMLMLKFKRKK